jgi:hypothetical protein
MQCKAQCPRTKDTPIIFKGKSDRKSAKALAEKDREPPSSGEGIFPCGVGLRSYVQGFMLLGY